MKIYTKSGDKGETGLLGNARTRKTDTRIHAIGDVDELNAALGLVGSLGSESAESQLLPEIQSALFETGSILAWVPGSLYEPNPLGGELTAKLETSIDGMTEALEPLRNFILPGGTELAARLHFARTVCRRAERSVLELHAVSALPSDVLMFLNRLSDWLFVFARMANQRSGVPDLIWTAKKS